MAEVDSRWRSLRVFSSADWMPLKKPSATLRQRRPKTVLYLTDDPEAVAFIIGNVSRIRAFEVGGAIARSSAARTDATARRCAEWLRNITLPPLSGGDRKALKKELSKSRAMTRIFAE